MDVYNLYAKVGLDSSEYEKNVEKVERDGKSLGGKLVSALGGGVKAVAKGTTAIIGAVGAATGAAMTGLTVLGKASISAYSEYEQLTGGVETLFKTSSDKVMEYANNAYMTAGMASNEYMNTVTSFSASLLQGLGGNTAAAAEIANQAIIDMSDNANKMGTDISMIQSAYQGFAKQNYTMLDNLKLGYGGTASEMARLINDSGVLGDSIEVTAETVNNVSFDKMIEAIHKVQGNLDITGTTSKEAASTIQGSISTMKAAWENFITGLADPEQDFDVLLGNLVSSIVTVGDNLIPRIQKMLPRLVEGVSQLAQNLVSYIPSAISSLLPAFTEGALSLVREFSTVLPDILTTLMQSVPDIVSSLSDMANTILSDLFNALPNVIDTLSSSLPELIPSIVSVAATLFNSILTLLPQLAEIGLTLLVELVNGIANHIDAVTETITTVIVQLVSVLTNPDNLSSLLSAGLSILLALVNGVVAAIPQLIEQIPLIIANLIVAIQANLGTIISSGIDIIFALINGIADAVPELVAMIPELIIALVNGMLNNMDKIILTGVQIIVSLIVGLANSIPRIITYIPTIISSIVNTFKSFDWGDIGKNIMEGLKDGLKNALSSVINAVKDIGSKISGKFKEMFGIASPSKLFKTFGGYLDEGLAIGITANADKPIQATRKLSDTMTQALSVDYTTPAAQPVSGTGVHTLAQSVAQEMKVIVGFDLKGMDFARSLNPYLQKVTKEVGA